MVYCIQYVPNSRLVIGILKTVRRAIGEGQKET